MVAKGGPLTGDYKTQEVWFHFAHNMHDRHLHVSSAETTVERFFLGSKTSVLTIPKAANPGLVNKSDP